MSGTLIDSIMQSNASTGTASINGYYALLQQLAANEGNYNSTYLNNLGSWDRNRDTISGENLRNTTDNTTSRRGQDLSLQGLLAQVLGNTNIAQIGANANQNVAGINAGASNYSADQSRIAAQIAAMLGLQGTQSTAQASRDVAGINSTSNQNIAGINAGASRDVAGINAGASNLAAQLGLQGQLGSAQYGMQGQIGAAQASAQPGILEQQRKLQLTNSMLPYLSGILGNLGGISPAAAGAAGGAAPALNQYGLPQGYSGPGDPQWEQANENTQLHNQLNQLQSDYQNYRTSQPMGQGPVKPPQSQGPDQPSLQQQLQTLLAPPQNSQSAPGMSLQDMVNQQMQQQHSGNTQLGPGGMGTTSVGGDGRPGAIGQQQAVMPYLSGPQGSQPSSTFTSPGGGLLTNPTSAMPPGDWSIPGNQFAAPGSAGGGGNNGYQGVGYQFNSNAVPQSPSQSLSPSGTSIPGTGGGTGGGAVNGIPANVLLQLMNSPRGQQALIPSGTPQAIQQGGPGGELQGSVASGSGFHPPSRNNGLTLAQMNALMAPAREINSTAMKDSFREGMGYEFQPYNPRNDAESRDYVPPVPATNTNTTSGDGTSGANNTVNYPMPTFGNSQTPPVPTFQGIDPETLQRDIAHGQSQLAQNYGGIKNTANNRLAAGGFRTTGPGAAGLQALLSSREAGQQQQVKNDLTDKARQFNSTGALPYGQAGLDFYNANQNRGLTYTLGQQSNRLGSQSNQVALAGSLFGLLR